MLFPWRVWVSSLLWFLKKPQKSGGNLQFRLAQICCGILYGNQGTPAWWPFIQDCCLTAYSAGLSYVLSIDFPERENCNNNLGRSGITVTWFAFIPYGSRQSRQFPGAMSCWKWHVSPGFACVKALKKCFPGVTGSPSSFPFQLISIPLLFFSSHPSSCRWAWRGLFWAPAPQEQQQRSGQPVLLGSLAQALAAASEAEGVACQMQNCISDAILVKNHIRTVLCFHTVLFLSFGQRNVLALSCSNLYVNSLLPFLKALGYESCSHWGTMVMGGFQIPKTKSVIMVAVVLLIPSWSSLYKTSSMWGTYDPD